MRLTVRFAALLTSFEPYEILNESRSNFALLVRSVGWVCKMLIISGFEVDFDGYDGVVGVRCW